MAKRSSRWSDTLAFYRPLILALGEVGFAYNRLHECFFNLFLLAISFERQTDFRINGAGYTYGLSLWHVLQNDKQQRQMAVTALAKLPTDLPIKDGVRRLEWALKRADKLAEYRNLIIHSPINLYPQSDATIQPVRFIPKIGGISTKIGSSNRLRRIKSDRFWKTLRNDLLELGDYVDCVVRQIWTREYGRANKDRVLVGVSYTWPRRPRLPSLHRISEIETPQTTAKPPRSRRDRRQPSRG